MEIMNSSSHYTGTSKLIKLTYLQIKEEKSEWYCTPETLIKSLEEIEDPNKRAALCNKPKVYGTTIN
jgi:hypothetical protein